MSDKKSLPVSIRLYEAEKEYLKSKAEDQCMSLNQYMRYQLLENNYLNEAGELAKDLSHLRSNEHLEKMTKSILRTRYYVEALIKKTFSEAEEAEIDEAVEEAFERYGIPDKE